MGYPTSSAVSAGDEWTTLRAAWLKYVIDVTDDLFLFP